MSSMPNPLAAQATETQTSEGSLLDQIVAQGRFGRDATAPERGKDMVKEFVNQVLEGKMALTRDAEATIAARVAEIDRLISMQLNEVLHHPSFQKLEATWRGIKHLLDQSETSEMLKIKLLNASKKDLLRDLQRAGSSIRARSSRRSTKRSSAYSAALPSRRWWATTSSAAAAKMWNCWRGCRRLPPRPMRPSSPRPRRR